MDSCMRAVVDGGSMRNHCVIDKTYPMFSINKLHSKGITDCQFESFLHSRFQLIIGAWSCLHSARALISRCDILSPVPSTGALFVSNIAPLSF